jgi:hypothetical protein
MNTPLADADVPLPQPAVNTRSEIRKRINALLLIFPLVNYPIKFNEIFTPNIMVYVL